MRVVVCVVFVFFVYLKCSNCLLLCLSCAIDLYLRVRVFRVVLFVMLSLLCCLCVV